MRCKKYRFKLANATLAAVILLQLCAQFAFGQNIKPGTGGMVASVQEHYNAYPAEKLYLKIDRPYYTVTDTIWFKAWLFEAASFTPSKKSGKLYIELINDSSAVITRFAIPLKMGLGNGQIALGKQLNQGNYTLRAYTNWMQNFGSNTFFSSTIYVAKPLANGTWLVNEQHNITAGNNLNLDVTLSNLNSLPVTYKDVELKLTDGSSTLFKSNFTTGDDGKLHTKFELPSNTTSKQLYLSITDKATKNKIEMPFYPGGTSQNIDLQFMPKGGSIIGGLTSRLGFKAIGEDGLGVDVQGIITDSKGKQAGSFKSIYNGMGSFILHPQPGENYTANFNVNNIKHTAVLPNILADGMVLKVDNLSSSDSVLVRITAMPGMVRNKPYTLLVQSAGGVYLGAEVDMSEGYSNLAFAKSTFVTGIVNFTVLDGTQTIAQRKIFIDHHDRLTITTEPLRSAYLTNDSLAVTVNVADALGKPVKGSFAVAITDDSLVKQDQYQENIISRLLLTSELSGNIENPAWYFSAKGDLTVPALDNLMLTQGWAGFDNSFYNKPVHTPLFLAEADNSVTGLISGLFNKPFKNAKVSIFTTDKKYGTILIDTLTDENGRFKLRDLPLTDSILYHMKTTSLKGKELGAIFTLDKFKPAKIDNPQSIVPMPWYAQSTNVAMSRYYSSPPQELSDIDPGDVKGKLLKQVVIKGSKPIDAKTYIPMVRKVIDEKTLTEVGNMNLRDLLAKKFNSLYITGFYTPDKETEHYLIGSRVLADVKVDGESMRQMYREQFVPTLRQFFYYVPASEIKSIRIYDGFYAMITIETRGGTGLNTFPTPGMIVYHPVPYNLPVRFYSPKYKVNNNALQNPRPTLYWEPNLITDEKGKASFSFFAAGKAGSYTISIEGADMTGNFGAQIIRIKIEDKTAN